MLLLLCMQQPRRWQAWRCIAVSYPGRAIRSDLVRARRGGLCRVHVLCSTAMPLPWHHVRTYMLMHGSDLRAMNVIMATARKRNTGSLSILSFAGVEVPSLWRSSTSSSIPHHSSVMQSPEYADTYTTCRRHLPSRTVQAAVGAGTGNYRGHRKVTMNRRFMWAWPGGTVALYPP